jgi:hypothetical protein
MEIWVKMHPRIWAKMVPDTGMSFAFTPGELSIFKTDGSAHLDRISMVNRINIYPIGYDANVKV